MLSNNSTQLATLKFLFEANPTATGISRLSDNKFVMVNEAFIRLHGYARDEVIGHCSEELKIWYDCQSRSDILAALENGEVVDHLALQWRHKSGQVGVAIMSARIVHLDGESFLAGFLTDARLLNEQQQSLVEADFFYSTLFNEQPNGIAVCRMCYQDGVPVDFIYQRVNPAFERVTGLSNVVGRWVSEVIPGIRDTNPELFQIYGRVAMGSGPEIFETYVSQLKIWLGISVFSHQPEHFVAVLNIITNHKQLEQELRESSDRLHLVLKASKLGTWDIDRSTGLVVFDKRWCEIIGLPQEELIHTTQSWLELIHPEDKARMVAALKQYEDENLPIFQCEYRLRHELGHWVWVSSRGQVVARGPHGNPLRILGTVMDISGPRNLAYEGAEFLRRIEMLVQDLVVGKDANQDAYPAMMVPEEVKLSRRQREVLILIAQGMTSSEIAKKLDLGTSTVISHRRSLMKVLGLHSAADLTRFAIKHDLVSE
jgi:PAS domain S-box-containing protein